MRPIPAPEISTWSASPYPAAPRAVIGSLILAAFIFSAVVVADFITGWELKLTILYVGPIALLAWRVNRTAALVASVLAVVATLTLDLVSPVHYSRRAFLYWEAIANFGFFVLIALIVSRLRAVHTRLDRLSTTDPLTGLPNWRAFSAVVERELARALRSGRPTSFVYFDLDGFKRINDSLGHGEGDRVLATIAKVLEGGRASDFPVRLGGDEFGVLMPETEGEAAARAVERMRQTLNDAMDKRGWHVRASYGIATVERAEGVTLEDLVHSADNAMLQAKAAGKDRIVLAAPPAAPPALDASLSAEA